MLGSSLDGPAWGAIPVTLGLGYYLLILRKTSTPLKALRLNSRHSVWIFLLFCGIGLFDSWFHKPMQLSKEELDSYIAAEGEVTAIDSYANGDRLIIKVNRLADRTGGIRECRNLSILLNTDGFSSSVGDIIVFPANLKQVTDNPNFRPSGYADRLKKRGLLYRCHSTCENITLKGCNNTVVSKSTGFRDNIIRKIEKSGMNRDAAEFLSAILLGDRTLLSSDIKESFSNAGVAHIIALSGMHVAIIMGIFLFILFPLRLLGFHLICYWIALAFVWIYAFISGMAPSTVRACVMTTFVVMALSLQRKNSAGNALLASAFVIILFDPMSIYNIGMQLSFLCVACILAFAGPLNTVSHHNHPKLYAVTSAVLVSLVTTLGTWVLVSFYFKKIPLLFLPVNLIILPLLPLFMSIALVYVTLLMAGHNSYILAWVLNNGYDFFAWATNTLSAYGEATISFQVQLPVVIMWIIGVLVIGYAIKKSHKGIAIITGCLIMAGSIALIPVLSPKAYDGLIFQRNISEISLALYDSDNERVECLPRNAVSRIFHKGAEIMSIDCNANLDSIARLNRYIDKKSRNRYLILGSGAKGIHLKDIPGYENFDKIIIHSSMRKKIEADLLNEALEIGLDKIHSLREDGPLEVEFSQR